jgi:hypothetical protein
MKKTMSEASQNSDDHPEPSWIGTLLVMLYCFVLIVIAFRRDAALKRSENEPQSTLPP